MSEKPKRTWFRFHLSTMVVAGITVSGILALNAQEHTFQQATDFGFDYSYWGWPFTFRKEFLQAIYQQPQLNVGSLVLDVLIGLSVVSGVAILSESLIRRREGRKQMSETEKPKRKFWQFHLATLMALTLCVGAILGQNIVEKDAHLEFEHCFGASGMLESCFVRGWPLRFQLTINWKAEKNDSNINTGEDFPDTEDFHSSWQGPYTEEGIWEPGATMSKVWWRIALDAVIGIAICVGAAISTEFLIRRREARKP